MDMVLTVVCYELYTFDLIILCLDWTVWLREQVAILTAMCNIFKTGIPIVK